MYCVKIPIWFVGLFKIVLIFTLFILVTTLITIVYARQIIMDDWDTYRCNPLVIPLAGLFGHDSSETMSQCMFMNFKATSNVMMNPFVNTFNVFSGTLGSASEAMKDMNFVLGSVRNTFASGFSGILGRIGNLSSAAQYLMVKMETLLQRLTAILVVAMYSLYSILQGLRVIKNDRSLLNAIDTILKFPGF